MSEAAKADSRISSGAIAVSVFGTLFLTTLVCYGSYATWRSDPVLGLFEVSGWQYSNLVSGDGKITFVIGAAGTLLFIAGAVFRVGLPYLAAASLSFIALALSIMEIACIQTAGGVASPGIGLYMVTGGAVIGLMLGMCGYFITREKATLPRSPGRDSN